MLQLLMQKNKSAHKYRYERKYMLTSDAAYILARRISAVMPADAAGLDGKYKVSSLYFDDMYNSALHEKKIGLLARDKFRVRYYNNSLDMLRLERKHKNGEAIFKESTVITSNQFKMMCQNEYSFMNAKWDIPVFKDFYKLHLERKMRPVALVEYNRQAYTYAAGNVRITFDSELTGKLPGPAGADIAVLPEGKVILEVKYDRFIPSVITNLLAGVPCTQQLALSKFVMTKMELMRIQGGVLQ